MEAASATTAGGQQEPRGKRKLSKKERQALKRQRSASQARAGPPAATQSQNPSQQKKKGKGRKGKQPASDRADSPAAAPDAAAGGAGPAVLQAPMSAPMSAAAQAQLDAIASGSVKGTLSDRLNAKNPAHDPALKAGWSALPKRERAAIVAADKAALSAAAAAVKQIRHPFKVNPDDHCESPEDAYRDAAPLLSLLAKKLGKSPAELAIYDPFFCAGAMRKHLAGLGFTNVYNECEDFYGVQASGRVPQHDVVVTNPPYSGDHPEKLLRWLRDNGKPFMLLMPNYFLAKDYYHPALGGEDDTKSRMLYLCPRKRYQYWTPKGMRRDDRVQKQHAGAGGYRTSPFVSFWYIDLTPAVTQAELLKMKAGLEQAGRLVGAGETTLCKAEDMPPGVKPFFASSHSIAAPSQEGTGQVVGKVSLDW